MLGVLSCKKYLRGQPAEIEVILDEILVNLREELIPFQAAKPANPGSNVFLTAGTILRGSTICIRRWVFWVMLPGHWGSLLATWQGA
jgi:hypothetical protein